MSKEHLEYVRENYLRNGSSGDTEGFYEQVVGSKHVSDKDAAQMQRMLNRGDVDQVEEKLENLLV